MGWYTSSLRMIGGDEDRRATSTVALTRLGDILSCLTLAFSFRASVEALRNAAADLRCRAAWGIEAGLNMRGVVLQYFGSKRLRGVGDLEVGDLVLDDLILDDLVLDDLVLRDSVFGGVLVVLFGLDGVWAMVGLIG